MVITSLDNSKVKDLIKLQMKKYRDISSKYLVEGEHLIEEAYKAGVLLEVILVEGSSINIDVTHTYVSSNVMKKISVMDTSINMIGLCKKNEDVEITGNHILLIDDVQTPGNLGTIIRSAVAFGIDGIVLSNNTVDLYNPKVLRATQGMYCHLPIIRRDLEEFIKEYKSRDYKIYGTNVVNGVDVRELSASDREKYCFIVGNEGNGVRESIQNMCDLNLYIPMNSKVESLNVGVACSILLYELGR